VAASQLARSPALALSDCGTALRWRRYAQAQLARGDPSGMPFLLATGHAEMVRRARPLLVAPAALTHDRARALQMVNHALATNDFEEALHVAVAVTGALHLCRGRPLTRVRCDAMRCRLAWPGRCPWTSLSRCGAHALVSHQRS
jgi:hypothetical protein